MKKLLLFPLLLCTLPVFAQHRLDWWHEARFGMFIHWGVYSQLAGRFDNHEVNRPGEWIMNWGKISVADYKQAAKQFNPTNYNPEEWVKLAKAAGMKYIIITAKHHDGFALFRTNTSKWNVVDATPYGKDLLAPLAEACKKHGIRLGFYYSQAQDWVNPGGTAIRRLAADGWANPDSTRIDEYTKTHAGHWDPAQQTDSFSTYLNKVAIPQVKELLTNYGEVSVLWWDTPAGMTDSAATELQSLLRLEPNIITNDRLKRPNFPGDYKTPEQKIPKAGEYSTDWETCMTMNNTWGYKSSDSNWKSDQVLIRNLIDIISKGGNYLLNVGPKGDGSFPEQSVSSLKAIGNWMKINGEAIYGSQPANLPAMPWGRASQKGNYLYLFVFDWPANGELTIPGEKLTVFNARLLANKNKLTTNNMTIKLPQKAPDPIATVIKVQIKR